MVLTLQLHGISRVFNICLNIMLEFIELDIKSNIMNSKILKKLIEFRDERDWKQFHTPEALAKSISIESAELLECFQWSSKYKKQDVIEELADVFIYATLMAHSIGVDIEEIILNKIEQNRKNYPISLSKGNSQKKPKK